MQNFSNYLVQGIIINISKCLTSETKLVPSHLQSYFRNHQVPCDGSPANSSPITEYFQDFLKCQALGDLDSPISQHPLHRLNLVPLPLHTKTQIR